MTKAESAASRTPRPGVLYFSPDQKDYWAPKRIRILHDYIAALELEAADLRSENNQLRRLIEKGRDSNATELGLSAQVDMYRDGAAKLLTQVEEANATIKDLRERAENAEAALTAQQEPVAEVVMALSGRATTRGEIKLLGEMPPIGTKLYTAPPSGVREGMLRGAEIAGNIKVERASILHKRKKAECAEQAFDTGWAIEEAITRAAEQVNAEGQIAENRGDHGLTGGEPVPSAPAPQPADGVVVPRIVTDEMRWAAENWAETRPHIYVQELWEALLAAAKEPRK